MRSPNPASGACSSALAINEFTHAPVTPMLPLYGIDTAAQPFVQKIPRLVAVRSEQFESLPESCAIRIRRERSAETPKESVATARRSARPEVFAPAPHRGSQQSALDNSAVPAPSAAATRGFGSPIPQLVPDFLRNSADCQAVGSRPAPFETAAQTLPGAPVAIVPVRSPVPAAIAGIQPRPARAMFLLRSLEAS